MLKSWPEYHALSKQTLAPPDYIDPLPEHIADDWLKADAPARLVSLEKLHNNQHLWLLPAYAQTGYIYDNHAITHVDEARYHHTQMIDRVNQFDAMGPSYGSNIKDITIEYRLGSIVSTAAMIVAKEEGIMLSDGRLTQGALMVIDGLRTVEATYLLAAANPLALESKLLSTPGTSAHNKGMAVDLTLIYYDEARNSWCDADMLGHIDHPDMVTNHRNYHQLSDTQRHNRIYFEQVMLRAAFKNGLLLAPLREEFWDFRFPEDGLDLWRVLESIARAANIPTAFEICKNNIEMIRKLYQTGHREEAYKSYMLNQQGFAEQCIALFDSEEARTQLEVALHITLEELTKLEPVYHGNVGLVFDAMLPTQLHQANPQLVHLFQ